MTLSKLFEASSTKAPKRNEKKSPAEMQSSFVELLRVYQQVMNQIQKLEIAMTDPVVACTRSVWIVSSAEDPLNGKYVTPCEASIALRSTLRDVLTKLQEASKDQQNAAYIEDSEQFEHAVSTMLSEVDK